MSRCKHGSTGAEVRANFMEDTGQWVIELEVKCTECGTPFEFQGVPVGFSFASPTMSLDATTVSLPAMPHGERATPGDLLEYRIKGLQS